MTDSADDASRKAWAPWLVAGQRLETHAKSSPLLVIEIAPDYIKVQTRNGKSVNLDYRRLGALWARREYVHSENSRRGKEKVFLNHLANRVWREAQLPPDKTNESYYWAVICTREEHAAGLLGLDSDYEATEGNPALRQHLMRERARWLVNQKKQEVLRETGSLVCEACGFDYSKVYPGLGKGFCEVHHRAALAEGNTITKLSDLAILCSNCHRMIHRTDPMEPVETFRNRLTFG